ncbi:MAG: hypothetical protein PHV53_09350 [Fermentimonas sp.]|nr:hypothetical protein [Fermentimonas sp.]
MAKRKPIIIGNNTFDYKKDAIAHYRKILISYSFGESLNESDFYDLIDLLNYDYTVSEDELELDESDIYIIDIKVSKVQFSTKCFEVFYSDNSSCYISYLMILNNTKYTPEKLFNAACRSAINKDIRDVKQRYFDQYSIKGQVKCQETGILSKWTELTVDHRQPNTFSVIVDRFKELKGFDLDKIEYKSDDNNFIIFDDSNIAELFREYHKEKANLRLVRNECNSGRTSLAIISRTNKDLKIE